MKTKSGKAASVPSGLGLSLLVNVFITITSVGVLAAMLDHNTVSWEKTGYWIMTTLLVASFCGGKTAISAVKTQKFVISLMSGILYWIFLLCITALFFGGQYSSVVETVLLILSGTSAAALLYRPYRSNHSKKNRRFNG